MPPIERLNPRNLQEFNGNPFYDIAKTAQLIVLAIFTQKPESTELETIQTNKQNDPR